jgi:acetylornithine deacetylase/succinyl-diaminopimelate desuccinylase-like protein
MKPYVSVDSYLETHLDESIDELTRLVTQPSVAAQNWGLVECANIVKQMLEKRGFFVEILATDGAPVVFAQRNGVSQKTLLIYNHYDVQPPEPLELWESPPFEPALRDGKLFGRGVSDDKRLSVAVCH